MPKVFANVMIQNEALILPHVHKYWKDYPVDQWVFYNDCSTDNTLEVISDLFPDATVFNNTDTNFSEARNRGTMWEFSRSKGANYVLAIDADELLSANAVDMWDDLLRPEEESQLYWYNVVGSMKTIRQDPNYLHNYRSFFVPMHRSGMFNPSHVTYHTPRTPRVFVERQTQRKDVGVIHLQAINKRYYALKQLWYKHYEVRTWGKHPHYVNQMYDGVVNNFNFNPQPTPAEILGDIKFDASVYDEIEKAKGYKEYILNNLDKTLVTFGEEYLND